MQKPIARILLKLSGEAFAGPSGYGIDFSFCEKVAKALRSIRQEGIDVAVVVGAGNLFRGGKRANKLCGRIAADQIGLLATMMNGIALQETLASMEVDAYHFSAIGCSKLVEAYSSQKGNKVLSQGSLLILSGGTGNPYFTTDTAAALRAKELHVDLLLKATNVSGVYDKDPNKYEDAKLYKQLTFTEALQKDLNVMDMTAFALCKAEDMPIFVFDLNLLFSTPVRVIVGGHKGTLVRKEL